MVINFIAGFLCLLATIGYTLDKKWKPAVFFGALTSANAAYIIWQYGSL